MVILEIFKNSWHTEYSNAVEIIDKANNEILSLDMKIKKFQEIIDTSHKTINKSTINEINENLKACFKHDRISFQFLSEKNCYTIIRKDIPAKYLSDGEKNMIALIYFLQTLKNSDVIIEDTCVVFDDPATSFDEQNLEYAVATIMNNVVNTQSQAGQFILLSHNAALIRKILWKINIRQSKNNRYFLLSKNLGNNEISLSRMDMTKFTVLDAYCLLFKQVYNLYQNKDNLNELEQESAANIMRKFIETFYEFYFPWQWNLASNIEHLISKKYTSAVSTKDTASEMAILLDGGSHKEYVASRAPWLLENIMGGMKELYPFHYQHMEKLIKGMEQGVRDVYQEESISNHPSIDKELSMLSMGNDQRELNFNNSESIN